MRMNTEPFLKKHVNHTKRNNSSSARSISSAGSVSKSTTSYSPEVTSSLLSQRLQVRHNVSGLRGGTMLQQLYRCIATYARGVVGHCTAVVCSSKRFRSFADGTDVKITCGCPARFLRHPFPWDCCCCQLGPHLCSSGNPSNLSAVRSLPLRCPGRKTRA